MLVVPLLELPPDELELFPPEGFEEVEDELEELFLLDDVLLLVFLFVAIVILYYHL